MESPGHRWFLSADVPAHSLQLYGFEFSARLESKYVVASFDLPHQEAAKSLPDYPHQLEVDPSWRWRLKG
jgi:hypothetical protein